MGTSVFTHALWPLAVWCHENDKRCCLGTYGRPFRDWPKVERYIKFINISWDYAFITLSWTYFRPETKWHSIISVGCMLLVLAFYHFHLQWWQNIYVSFITFCLIKWTTFCRCPNPCLKCHILCKGKHLHRPRTSSFDYSFMLKAWNVCQICNKLCS